MTTKKQLNEAGARSRARSKMRDEIGRLTFENAVMSGELVTTEYDGDDADDGMYRAERVRMYQGRALDLQVTGGGPLDPAAPSDERRHRRYVKDMERISRIGSDCLGHPAGPYDPMGETVYCDGSCRVRR